MSHIRRAAKDWTCKTCGGQITKGTRCFCVLGTTLPYGRYIGTMVEARHHLICATPDMACCKEGEKELRAVQV